MQHLALRIYKGTHGAPPDERPLVSIGAVPDTFSPVVTTLVDEPETWILVHRYDYTLYVYQVTQEDTTYRQICLLVPVGIRLSADNNPYGLLLELWGMLESQGNQHALFEERLVLSIIGEQVSDMRLPVMEGQQPASFCADSRMQVKALLMFSLYPQLTRVSRLEIGLHCASTISLPIKANPKKVVPSEPVHQLKSDKPQVEPSVCEDTQEEQTDRRRNVGKKVALYAFLLVAAVAVVGFVLDEMGNSSDTLNLVLSTDTLVAEEKPLIAEEKPDAQIEEAAPVDDEMVDSVPYRGMRIIFPSQTKENETERGQAREEILELVNRQIRIRINSKEEDTSKLLQRCRNHRGWKFLSNEERWAVEAILGNPMKTLRSSDRIKFEELMKESVPFRSFDEIIKVTKDMVLIINEKKYRKKF